MRTQFLRMATALPLALTLAACGGGGGDGLTLHFSGTVSGNNCFTGAPESARVRYGITVSGTAAGSLATLADAQGATWQGSVGDGGAIEVRQPEADERFVIRGHDVFGAGRPRFEVTASCVSFRCCTTLSGALDAGG